MHKKTLWIAQTAIMTALLIALQFATKSLGQYVTGSCVNLVLTVSALVGGWWCGFTVALISPFFAYLIGVGPALIQLVPAISLGNIVLVGVLCLLCSKSLAVSGARGRLLTYAGAVAAAVCKFLVLFIVVVKLLVPALGLPEKQTATMSVMFSYPQLITALIGGLLGATIAPIIKRAKKS